MSTNPGLLERSVLGHAWNPRLVAVVSLALVFLCGSVAGALVWDLRIHNRLRPPAFETMQAHYFERLQKELNLNAAQSEQIKSILNDFWLYYRTVLSEGRTRIEQVLDSEQRTKFERLLQEQKR